MIKTEERTPNTQRSFASESGIRAQIRRERESEAAFRDWFTLKGSGVLEFHCSQSWAECARLAEIRISALLSRIAFLEQQIEELKQ